MIMQLKLYIHYAGVRITSTVEYALISTSSHFSVPGHSLVGLYKGNKWVRLFIPCRVTLQGYILGISGGTRLKLTWV
jgi:hypothetical protein